MPITQSDDYPETEDTASSETAQDAVPDTTDAEAEDESTTSALLPKSIMGGKEFKPGDTITLKVESVMEDEIQVCPVEEDSEEEDAGMKESMSKLDSMAMGGE